MTKQIIPYFILNNAEHDAIDLLLNVDKLEDISDYVNEGNFSKVHMYLGAVCGYCTDQDELVKILNILYNISLRLSEYTIALRFAIKLDDHDKIKQIFDECPDQITKKQLAFNAARQKIFIPDLDEEENKIISNSMLAKFYLILAKDLAVHEPKNPRDVFKMHLEDNYKGGANDKTVTLHNIYVNAFVNAGLTRDTLMIDDEEEEMDKRSWVVLLKDKEEWQIAAVASLGLLCPWNSDTIEQKLMPYIDNEGKYIKAGASLGVGMCCAGINDENDLAYALLSESAQESKESIIRQCSILGLGMAYAGRSRPELQDIFMIPIVDTDVPLEESAFAALSLGLSFVGQCNEEVAGAIVQTLMERSDEQLNTHTARYFGLGLALLYMGQQNKCEATLEAISAIEHPIKKFV